MLLTKHGNSGLTHERSHPRIVHGCWIAAYVLYGALHPQRTARPCNHLLDQSRHLPPQVFVEGAHGTGHLHTVGNNVGLGATLDSADGHYGWLKWRGPAAYYCLQRCDHVSRRDYSVRCQVRHSSMSATSLDGDAQSVRAGHDRPLAHSELSSRQAIPDVAAYRCIHAWVLQHALLDHGLGPTDALLGGLKHELDVAVDLVALLQQQARRDQQHAHVRVMSAGMHTVRVSTPEG